MDLLLKVNRILREERLIEAGDTVVCAVSGGADSMALLHVLHRLSTQGAFRLVAAHLHHGFRLEESDREAELVRRFVAQLGLPFEYHRADVPANAKERGMNAQAAAREVRYRFLAETAASFDAQVIALAHHQDDQAETVLLHMLQGAGTTGLAGMAISRNEHSLRHIRPFLRIPKQEIMAYVQQQAIPYCMDSSNLSRDYERNRLRLDVMPALLSFNPSLPQALSRMADILRDEDAYMEAAAAALEARIVSREAGRCTALRTQFLAEPVALQRRLIKLILNYLAQDPRFSDYGKIELIRTAIEGDTPSLTLSLGAALRFRRVYDRLQWEVAEEVDGSAKKEPIHFAYVWHDPGDAVAVPESGGVLEAEIRRAVPDQHIRSVRDEAWFDADEVQWPLMVRSRSAGDRLEPLGVNGSKKVKDIFIDLKIEPEERARIPIVADANGRILWIPGVRRSRHALVTGQSSSVLRLRYIRK